MPRPFSERRAIFPAGEAGAQYWLYWLGTRSCGVLKNYEVAKVLLVPTI